MLDDCIFPLLSSWYVCFRDHFYTVSLLTELLQLLQVWCLLELPLLFMTILISTLYLRCLTVLQRRNKTVVVALPVFIFRDASAIRRHCWNRLDKGSLDCCLLMKLITLVDLCLCHYDIFWSYDSEARIRLGCGFPSKLFVFRKVERPSEVLEIAQGEKNQGERSQFLIPVSPMTSYILYLCYFI